MVAPQSYLPNLPVSFIHPMVTSQISSHSHHPPWSRVLILVSFCHSLNTRYQIPDNSSLSSSSNPVHQCSFLPALSLAESTSSNKHHPPLEARGTSTSFFADHQTISQLLIVQRPFFETAPFGIYFSKVSNDSEQSNCATGPAPREAIADAAILAPVPLIALFRCQRTYMQLPTHS